MRDGDREDQQIEADRDGPAGPGDPLLAYGRALSGLTHDLRTRLGSIVAAASNIEQYSESLDPDSMAQLSAGIIEEAQRLDHLLTSLSVLAKAADGAIVPETREIELNELLRGLSRRAQEHSAPARVTVSPAPDDLKLVADPDLVRTTILTMLDLVAGAALRGGELTVTAGAGEQTVLLHTEGTTRPDAAPRIGKVVSALNESRPLASGADAVFLASLQQLVQILGGQLSATHHESESRFGIAVELPRG